MIAIRNPNLGIQHEKKYNIKLVSKFFFILRSVLYNKQGLQYFICTLAPKSLIAELIGLLLLLFRYDNQSVIIVSK